MSDRPAGVADDRRLARLTIAPRALRPGARVESGRREYPGRRRSALASGVAARIEATALAAGAISCATGFNCAGLWQRTSRSARSATSRPESSASPPVSLRERLRRARPQDRSRARAAPSSRHRTRHVAAADQSYLHGASGYRPAGSALVEKALFDQPRALLGGDLDVARGEHEDLVGDPLHAAVERVGKAAGEVDQAL